jgi:hypothetical protein
MQTLDEDVLLTDNLSDNAVNQLPGALALGRGFNILTARSVKDRLDRVIDLNTEESTTVTKFGIDYLVPKNVEQNDVNDNKTYFDCYATEKEYRDHKAGEASAEVSAFGFKGEFNASYSSLTEGQSTSYYGLLEAYSILWETSLKTTKGAVLSENFSRALAHLPAEYTTGTKHSFFTFFNLFGTHFVTATKVGGELIYLITVSSHSHIAKEKAKADLNAEYKSLFVDTGAKAKAEWESLSSNWIKSRKAKLETKGGDPTIMAGIVPPTSETQPTDNFSDIVVKWTKSLQEHAVPYSLTLSPISSVVTGAKSELIAKALKAYLNAPVQVKSTATFNRKEGIIDGHKVFITHITGCATEIMFDNNVISPPHTPSRTDVSMYWIVLADSDGNIVYNNNSISQNPDEFDKLVSEAKAISAGKQLWACVSLVNDVFAPISITATQWIESLGINLSPWKPHHYYPQANLLLTLLGKTNSPNYKGQISLIDPYSMNPKMGDFERKISVAQSMYADLNIGDKAS